MPTKIPPPTPWTPDVLSALLFEMVELVIVAAPLLLFVKASPPPRPSVAVFWSTIVFDIASVPTPLPSQSRPPPKPSPVIKAGLRPKRIVKPDILVAKANVKEGLMENILSIPLVVFVPAVMIVFPVPFPVTVNAWVISRSPVAAHFRLLRR